MNNNEKNIENLKNQKKNKAGIIEDMLSFIKYTPNRESDILAFIEQYQKAECEYRPKILENLRACIDGLDYPNPYANSYKYAKEDVSVMGKILDEYIDDLVQAEGDTAAIVECVKDAVLKINALNEECEKSLIDTWRRERLCSFINSSAELAGVTGITKEKDLTIEHRMW